VIDILKIVLTSLYPTMLEKRSRDLGEEILGERSRMLSSVATDSFSVNTLRFGIVRSVIHIVENLCCRIALQI
jgi:hypothetical protein